MDVVLWWDIVFSHLREFPHARLPQIPPHLSGLALAVNSPVCPPGETLSLSFPAVRSLSVFQIAPYSLIMHYNTIWALVKMDQVWAKVSLCLWGLLNSTEWKQQTFTLCDLNFILVFGKIPCYSQCTPLRSQNRIL